jgi:hypothetical protein
MLVTLEGMVKLVRLMQESNAESPMLVTPSEIFTLARPEHPLNADTPMLATLPGIFTLLRFKQSENAASPILVTGRLVPDTLISAGMFTAPSEQVYPVMVIWLPATV